MNDMNTPFSKLIIDSFMKEIESNLFLFGSSSSTSSVASTPLTYDDIVNIEKALPPPPPFNEIKISEKGLDKLKENFEFKTDMFGDIYLSGVQILVRDFMPDNMAVCLNRTGNDVQVVYVVDLGIDPVPFEGI